jgi:SAM-dependent methyltransferase
MDDLLELTGRAEATHFWFRGFRQFVSPLLADLADGRRDLRLIDCGCGTGNNLRLLTPYGRAIGFDVTHGGSLTTRRSGCPSVQADITRIPFASGVFDVATSFDVLQCVESDDDAVREMARIIKPGGAVVLTLAALDVLRGDHAEAWHEVRRYTPSSARRLIERAGLSRRARVVHVRVDVSADAGRENGAADAAPVSSVEAGHGYRRSVGACQRGAHCPRERRGRTREATADADRQLVAGRREKAVIVD